MCEDIYLSLKTGASTLHIDYAEDYGGFVVLTPLTTVSGKVLHITAAYSVGLRKIESYIPELEAMARAIGARELTLASTRNWGRYFSPKHTVYAKEV